MTHRLACAWGTRLAAAAPVAGANQHAAAGGACAGGTPVLHIHGTADPCWRFEESTATLRDAGGGPQGGRGPDDGRLARAQRLPGRARDRRRHARRRSERRHDQPARELVGCAADVELIRIEGGGHTWPQGDPYLPTDVVGPVARDFDADDVILEFFGAHVRAVTRARRAPRRRRCSRRSSPVAVRPASTAPRIRWRAGAGRSAPRPAAGCCATPSRTRASRPATSSWRGVAG